MQKPLKVIMSIVLTTTLVLVGCTSSTTPAGSGKMSVTSSLSATSVNSVNSSVKGNNSVQAVDSISVQRLRILFSRIKAHTNDTSEGNGKSMKVGPAMLTFTDVTTLVFATDLPVGTYQRLKLEMHKFSSSEANTYKGDPVFGDFAYPEKLTVIIDGTQYKDGVSTPFTLTFDDTENFWLIFTDPLVVTEGGTAEAILELDIAELFRVSGVVIDVNDLDNRKDLRKRLKQAFKLHKKKIVVG
ncbi:MAG: hypothetical protein HQ472_02195 [Ignavibacteria bacterium]|nr:hypothetical protein [Ignavibacteria bacterium]